MGPFVGVVGGHDVEVAVEDQRSPSPATPKHTDHIVSSGHLAEKLRFGSALPVDAGQQARHIGFAAHQVVIVLVGVGRIHAAQRDGVGKCVEQLIAKTVDTVEHFVCRAHECTACDCAAGDVNSPLSYTVSPPR